jgi:hypothetical protein
MALRLDWKDFVLAGIIAILGFLFTAGFFTNFLNSLNPIIGLIVYYIIFFIMVIVLSKLDLIIMTFQVKDWTRFIGMFLITMAFVIILSWGNFAVFVQNAKLPAAQQVGNVIYQSLDGVVWMGIAALIKPDTDAKFQIMRVIVYAVIPFILTLLGGFLLGKKDPEISPVG